MDERNLHKKNRNVYLKQTRKSCFLQNIADRQTAMSNFIEYLKTLYFSFKREKDICISKCITTLFLEKLDQCIRVIADDLESITRIAFEIVQVFANNFITDNQPFDCMTFDCKTNLYKLL